MNKIKLTIAIFALILVGCVLTDPASSSVTFTEGTYNLIEATDYDTVDCSGTGIPGVCTSDETATTEATCPSGGWVLYADYFSEMRMWLIIADGVWSLCNGNTGTYTVDGTTMTIVVDDDDTSSGTFADGTLSVEMPYTGGCNGTADGNEASEDDCDAAGGYWEDASCTIWVFTLSTDAIASTTEACADL